MPDPACPDCGAALLLAKEEGTGKTMRLERQTEPAGPAVGKRYRVVSFGPPMVVAALAADARVEGYPDHLDDCPAHGNAAR